MVSYLTVAGKSHTNHKYKRQDSKYKNAGNRRCKKCPVQLLIKQFFEILTEAVHMFAFFCAALCLIGALHICPPGHDEQTGQKHGSNAIKEKQERHVSCCVFVDTFCFIPHLFLCISAQCNEVFQICDTACHHEPDICCFHGKEQQSLNHLFMSNVPESHNDHGKLCGCISFGNGLTHLVRFIKLFCFLFPDCHTFPSSFFITKGIASISMWQCPQVISV